MSVCCFCPLTEKEKKSKVQINGALIESSDGAMRYSYRISVWHRLKWLYRASVTAGWCTRPIHSVNFLYSIAVFTHTLQLWNVLDISLQSYMWKKKTAQSGQLHPHHKKISKPFSQWRMQLIKITIRLAHTQLKHHQLKCEQLPLSHYPSYCSAAKLLYLQKHSAWLKIFDTGRWPGYQWVALPIVCQYNSSRRYIDTIRFLIQYAFVTWYDSDTLL